MACAQYPADWYPKFPAASVAGLSATQVLRASTGTDVLIRDAPVVNCTLCLLCMADCKPRLMRTVGDVHRPITSVPTFPEQQTASLLLALLAATAAWFVNNGKFPAAGDECAWTPHCTGTC